MKASFPTPSAVSGSFSNFFYTLPKDFYLVHHLYICSDPIILLNMQTEVTF